VQVRFGMHRVLATTSVLASAAIAGSLLLIAAGDATWLLAIVVGFQSIATGMGNAALTAYIANLTDPRFTATQFAVLTAIATLPHSLLTAPTGWVAAHIGWLAYFSLCAVLGLVGLVLLCFCRQLFREPDVPSTAP
jgi:MFS transporter, PAT family, beta-lactamase induction signal transducer AmpG